MEGESAVKESSQEESSTEKESPTQPTMKESTAEPKAVEVAEELKTGSEQRKLPVKPVRRPQLSSEGLEYDAIYISPLDSSWNVFFAGLAVVFLASLCTRLYKISEPDHIA